MVARKAICYGFALLILSGAGCIVMRERERPVKYATLHKSKAVERETSLSIDLKQDVGQMTISPADSGLLYNLELDYDENNATPVFKYNSSGGHGRLDFRLERSHRWFRRLRGDSREKLDVQITTAVPVDLRLKTGASETKIDLSGIRVKSFDLKAGVGEANISITKRNPIVCDTIDIKTGVGGFKMMGLANANFNSLRLYTGVGEARLDFTGDWSHDAEVEVKAGVGQVTVILPRDLGVELESQRGLLSSLHLESFHKSGDLYRSDNYDTTKHHLRIRMRAGIGGVEIKWA